MTWGDPAFGGDSHTVQDELVDVHRVHAASGAFAAVRHDGRVVTWGDPWGGGDSSNLRTASTTLVTSAAW